MSSIKLKDTLTLTIDTNNQTASFKRISVPNLSKPYNRTANRVSQLPKMSEDKQINIRRPRYHQIIPYSVPKNAFDPKPWAFVLNKSLKNNKRFFSDDQKHKRKIKSLEKKNKPQRSEILLGKYIKRKYKRQCKQINTVYLRKAVTFNTQILHTDSSCSKTKQSPLNYFTEQRSLNLAQKQRELQKQKQKQKQKEKKKQKQKEKEQLKYENCSYQQNIINKMQGRIKWKNKIIDYIKQSLQNIKYINDERRYNNSNYQN